MNQLERENACVLALVQAMVGAISPNFRRVSLSLAGNALQLQFVLEHESEEDREEIEDIEFEMEASLESAFDVDLVILVSDAPLETLPSAGRVVFGRRECSDDRGG